MPGRKKKKKTWELFGWFSGHDMKWLNDITSQFSFRSWVRNHAGRWVKGFRLAELAGSLPVIGRELEAISLGVEPLFLQMGSELQAIHSGALELTDGTLKSVEFIGGKSEEAVLSRVHGLAEESLEQLRTYQEQITTNLLHTDVIVEKLDALYRACEEINKVSTYLRIVGLNIGIESSRSDESKDMFKVVVEEIRDFSEKVSRIAEEIRDDTKTARTMQTSARAEMTKTLNELNGLESAAAKSLRDAVENIEELVERSRVALDHASEHSQEISQQVGRVVVEIQFQDSMKQRIEHIIRALGDAVSLCSKRGKNSNPGATELERLDALYSILSLQAAQLGQVISEVRQVHENALRAFRRIAAEILSLVGSLSQLRSNNGRSESPFISLKTALDQLGMLLGKGKGMARCIEESVSAATETATSLAERTEYVREISYQTRLMAMNAVIKAVHLDKTGMTLEVLAQEVSVLSRKTSIFAEEVQEAIDPLVSSAQELIARFTKTRTGSGSKDMAPDLSDLPSLEISKAYEQFKKDSSEILISVEVLKNFISKASSGLSFLKTLKDDMTPVLKELEEMVELLRHDAGRTGQGTLEKTRAIRERYTMEHEREIHEKTVEYTETPPDGSVVVQVSADGSRRRWKNHRPKVALSQGIINEAAEEWENGNTLAGEDNDPGVENPLEHLGISRLEDSEETEDLGDNVELF